MTTNMLKIALVVFLSGVGIWVAIGFRHNHLIEKRVLATETTVENALILTHEDGFKVVSATADHDGNICLEYTSHNARALDDIGYAVYERGEPKCALGWLQMSGAIGAMLRGVRILLFWEGRRREERRERSVEQTAV